MILLDAHVHVYPFYDLARFLDAAVANMPLPSPSDHRVLALAKRHDCHSFERGVEEATISSGFQLFTAKHSIQLGPKARQIDVCDRIAKTMSMEKEDYEDQILVFPKTEAERRRDQRKLERAKERRRERRMQDEMRRSGTEE